MKNKYKIIVVLAVACIGIGVFFLFIGKLDGFFKGTENLISEEIGYSDETRIYTTYLSVSCDMETADDYRREIVLAPGKNYRISIENNTFTQDVNIRFLDHNGDVAVEEKIMPELSVPYELKSFLEAGTYQMELELPKGTNGTMEIEWNE